MSCKTFLSQWLTAQGLMRVTLVPFFSSGYPRGSSTIERDITKVCQKVAQFSEKLCPFRSARGGHKRLQPAVAIAAANRGRRGSRNRWERARGAERHQAPAKRSRQTHITPHHPPRWESWVGPIAWCHKGNKLPKIGTRAGNGFYWRTNQGGRFSGAQFRFWLDSYWHQGYQCVSYWEV